MRTDIKMDHAQYVKMVTKTYLDNASHQTWSCLAKSQNANFVYHKILVIFATVATKNKLLPQLISHIAFKYVKFNIVPIASVKQNVGPASMDTKSTLTETNANQLKIQQIVLSTKIVRFAILKKDA